MCNQQSLARDAWTAWTAWTVLTKTNPEHVSSLQLLISHVRHLERFYGYLLEYQFANIGSFPSQNCDSDWSFSCAEL